MNFILVVFLAGSYAGVFGTHSFKSEAACEKAKQILLSDSVAPYKTVFCIEDK